MSLELIVTRFFWAEPEALLMQVLINSGLDFIVGMWTTFQAGLELCALRAGCWDYVVAHLELSSCSARSWPGEDPSTNLLPTSHRYIQY